MRAKIFSTVTAALLVLALGSANAKEPMKLSDHQLDKVTGGASVTQVPILATILANGTNGTGGVNSFSPSTTTVVPTQTLVGLNLFTIH